jgi:hypothetical protein
MTQTEPWHKSTVHIRTNGTISVNMSGVMTISNVGAII